MDSGEFLLVIERYVDIEYNVRLFPLKLVGGPPQAAHRYYDTTSPPHLVPKIIKEAEKRRKKEWGDQAMSNNKKLVEMGNEI